MSSVGVLVMAHGTPARIEDVPAFYTSIRRGSPPPAELLAELVGRYEAIGGTSPLAELTGRQVDGLASALEARAPGRFRVAFGAKHTEPSIEAGAASLVARGVGEVVGLVLTPQDSGSGSRGYLERADAALAGTGVAFHPIAHWHRAPGLAACIGTRLQDALDDLARRGPRPAHVVFTAHSVPESSAGADVYARQVAETAADAAGAAGLAEAGVPWSVAFQSAGRTGDTWLGPDLLAEIRRLAAAGTASLCVAPVGFVSDHLEVLYDIDVEAAHVAAEAGIAAFGRTTSLNDAADFLAVLAGVVAAAAGPR